MRYFTATIAFQTRDEDADVAAMILGQALMAKHELVSPRILDVDPPESLRRLRAFFAPLPAQPTRDEADLRVAACRAAGTHFAPADNPDAMHCETCGEIADPMPGPLGGAGLTPEED